MGHSNKAEAIKVRKVRVGRALSNMGPRGMKAYLIAHEMKKVNRGIRHAILASILFGIFIGFTIAHVWF